MTSSSRRQEIGTASPPSFAKIIMDPKSDSLRIPPAFMERYGQNLPNRVLLKVPNGSISELDLVQSNGEALLQNGWRDFKERFSIKFGYFLVFKYNGKSQFDVVIFNRTSCEIDYPLFDANSEAEEESDDCVVVLEEFVNSKSVSAKQNISTQANVEDLSSFNSNLKHEFSDGVKGQRVDANGEDIAYQKALAFMSDNNNSNSFENPFVISVMRPSYVSTKFILNVPMKFAKVSVPSNFDGEISLVMNGEKWSVKCIVREVHKKAELSAGWKKFVQDNGLKVGDACIFEVATKDELVWNVTVFRSGLYDRRDRIFEVAKKDKLVWNVTVFRS